MEHRKKVIEPPSSDEELLDTIAGIERGLKEMAEGEGQPAQEVFDRLEKKYAFLQGE